MSTKAIVIGILAAGFLSAGSILVVMRPASEAEAKGVEVREDGRLVSSASAGDAVAEVTRRVGFEVKLPSSIPGGLELDSVGSALGPDGAPNALKLAILTYGPKDDAKRGMTAVRIEETGVRFGAPDGRAETVDLGLPGVDVYVQATARATGYWVFTADRGFMVTATGENAPTDGEMRAMIASLVR